VRRAEVVGVDDEELGAGRVAKPLGHRLHLHGRRLLLLRRRAAPAREERDEKQRDCRQQRRWLEPHDACASSPVSSDSSPGFLCLSTTELMQ
jgi:hypothetical protein